jgi:CheY-like chemotaxis protein
MSSKSYPPPMASLETGANIRRLRAGRRRELVMSVNLIVDDVVSLVTAENVSVSGIGLQGFYDHHPLSRPMVIQLADGRMLPASLQWARMGRLGLKFITALRDDDPLVIGQISTDALQAKSTPYVNQNTLIKSKLKSVSSILVVENLMSVGFLIKSILEKNGNYVELVGNGLSAVDAARRHVFDIIIINNDVPLLNGIAALLKIRELPSPHSSSFVMALSSGFNACGRWVYDGIEVDQYLLMPIHPAMLIADVSGALSERWLSKSSLRAAGCRLVG